MELPATRRVRRMRSTEPTWCGGSLEPRAERDAAERLGAGV
ncbi:hypothetical protein [Natronococcus pandeyae]|nr:hypothetical protein [Natronococcus pandeyae]